VSDDAGHVSRAPDGPWAGWLVWTDPVAGTFLDASIGRSYSRGNGQGKATVMLETRPSHANRLGALHGGFLAGFADHAYFAGLTAMGRPEQAAAVTVDLSMQYCGSGEVGSPLQAEVELLHETGRLMFMRLTIHQDDKLVASSTATVRKVPTPK
jgi:uncharacterized protein (TIGR00369 family)